MYDSLLKSFRWKPQAQWGAFGVAVLLFSWCGAAQEKSEKIAAADQLMEKNEAIQEEYTFQFKGRSYVGYPDVYSPVIFSGASKQTDLLVQKGECFLELGCGTGIFSVEAALGGASEVVATDINPTAVANTRENARRHGVNHLVQVLQGDLFAPLTQGKTFDVIFFNITFCHNAV